MPSDSWTLVSYRATSIRDDPNRSSDYIALRLSFARWPKYGETHGYKLRHENSLPWRVLPLPVCDTEMATCRHKDAFAYLYSPPFSRPWYERSCQTRFLLHDIIELTRWYAALKGNKYE